MHNTVSDISCPSFPKTGNTWLRVMLGRYFQRHLGLDFLPLMEGTHEEKQTVGISISFTHGPLTWDTQTAADLTTETVCNPYLAGRVILIVRHPLDVMLSHFMHVHHQRGRPAGVPETLDAFIRHPVWGIDKFIAFHNFWAAHIKKPGRHVVRYEDLRTDGARTLTHLIRFIGLHEDQSIIADALNFSSFESMRAMEDSTPPSYRSSGFAIFATGNRSNPDAYHVRSGKIGGYREHLSPSQLAEHEKAIQALSPLFGYR